MVGSVDHRTRQLTQLTQSQFRESVSAERVTAAVGGESSAGKTEIAEVRPITCTPGLELAPARVLVPRSCMSKDKNMSQTATFSHAAHVLPPAA